MGMPTYGVGFDVTFSKTYFEQAPVQVDAVVAIVGTGASKHLKYFPSVELALASSTDYPDDSTVKAALLDLKACGTECKVIISAFVKDNDETTNKNNALTAFDDIKKSEVQLGKVPTFIIGPGLRGKAYFDKMKAVSESLMCIFFWDTEKKVVSEVKNEVESCKSPRCVTTFQDVIRSDANNTVRPLSGFVLGNWLRIIFQSQFGLGESFSNKNINGITGIQDMVSHSYTQNTETKDLREAGVTMAVKAPGMLFWGDEVREERVVGYKSVREQLVVDLLQKRIEEACKYFIDQNIIDVIGKVVGLARGLAEDLKNRNIIFEYEVTPDKKRNTPAALASGKIWTIVKIQMNQFCKFIGVNVIITDEFSKNLLALQQA